MPKDPEPSSDSDSDDGVVSAFLWFGQCLGVVLGFMAAVMTAMSTDPCFSGVRCGSESWVTAAIWTSLIGGITLLAVFGAWTLRRLRRGRAGWPIAAAGVTAQLALIMLCVQLGTQAGPM